MNAKTKTLLKIVETWKLNEKPEYRGFRCANCQKYMHKAYYYWLDTKGYKTPVHFCRQCQKLFESFHIRITKLSHPINRKTFGLKFEQKFIQKCKSIAKKWNTKANPVYKTFVCDECGDNMHKAYHVWLNINSRLIEVHFCQKCGHKLKLNKYARLT